MSLLNLTPVQLRQAADLKERIASLTKELTAILGGSATPTSGQPAKPVVVKKGGMSAAGKARIIAAQKLRWAKVKAAQAKPAPKTAVVKPVVATPKAAAKVVTTKRVISPAARAKMAAAAKAMWAAKRVKKK